MKIHFDGKTYDYDGISLPEARQIQRLTGMKPNEWENACNERDSEAVAALILILRQRQGDQLDFNDLDAIPGAFSSLRFEATDAEKVDEPEDPKAPSSAS